MFKGIHTGLVHHLKEAWTINIERASLYSKLTRGKSLPMSIFLITMEFLTALPALLIDWQAKKFQKRGIPIIAKDIVSMEGIKRPESSPQYHKLASPSQIQQVESVNQLFQKTLRKNLAQNNFHQAAKEAYVTLKKIRRMEREFGCHFSMLSHLIESIGFGALHAADYAKLTRGDSRGVSKFYLRMHLWSLDISLKFDHQAQKIHAMGVGFLVNDIPEIPFVEEWEKRTNLR